MEMDFLETLLAEAQAKNKFHAQPGTVVEARLQKYGNTHFIGLKYAFAQPGVALGYTYVAALDGDYRHAETYAVDAPVLDKNLERAGRMAGNGYCSNCESKRLPAESIVDGQFQLACRECGFTEIVE